MLAIWLFPNFDSISSMYGYPLIISNGDIFLKCWWGAVFSFSWICFRIVKISIEGFSNKILFITDFAVFTELSAPPTV